MENIKRETPLDHEEKDLKDALGSIDVKNLEKPAAATQKLFKKAAANYVKKEAKMNIRIDPRDLEAIKRRAEEEGLKYQPFVRSVLQKYITGRLVEKSAR